MLRFRYNTIEVKLLKSLHVFILISIIISLIFRHYLLMAFFILDAFLLGIIGQGLHPLLSVKELSKGPTKQKCSVEEEFILPDQVKELIVKQACYKTSMLIAFNLFVILAFFTSYRWYWGVASGVLSLGPISTILTMTFLKLDNHN